MKKILLNLAALFILISGIAQEEKSKLFNKSDHYGGFGGVEFMLNKDSKLSVVGEGAYLYKNYYIGGFGYGASYDDALSPEDNHLYELSAGQGGFMLGAYSNTSNVFALFAETKFGFGNVQAQRETSANNFEKYDAFLFSFIPKVGISITPIQILQIRLDVGYQVTNNFDLKGIQNSAVQGYLVGIGVYFGYF